MGTLALCSRMPWNTSCGVRGLRQYGTNANESTLPSKLPERRIEPRGTKNSSSEEPLLLKDVLWMLELLTVASSRSMSGPSLGGVVWVCSVWVDGILGVGAAPSTPIVPELESASRET